MRTSFNSAVVIYYLDSHAIFHFFFEFHISITQASMATPATTGFAFRKILFLAQLLQSRAVEVENSLLEIRIVNARALGSLVKEKFKAKDSLLNAAQIERKFPYFSSLSYITNDNWVKADLPLQFLTKL